MSADENRPEGFVRVCAALRERDHPHAPLWLEVPVRTSQEAADHLGVAVGQIAKSVIFKRKSDDRAVLVITSGDVIRSRGLMIASSGSRAINRPSGTARLSRAPGVLDVVVAKTAADRPVRRSRRVRPSADRVESKPRR
jgi:Aminoacyl-tRNA editing domain